MVDSYFKHAQGESVLCLHHSDFVQPLGLRLESESDIKTFPMSSSDDRFFYFSIDHPFLCSVRSLEALRVVLLLTDGSEVDLKQHPQYPNLLACFDVDNIDTFWARVSTPARPVKDAHLLRLLCRRAVFLYRNFSVYGVALCALGYRVLDADAPNDPDAQWMLSHAEIMLNWTEEITPYEDARWCTSVLMLLGYYHLNRGDTQQAVRTLNRLMHYRSALKYAPLVQTNLVRSSLLLADYYINTGEYDRALYCLEEVQKMARDGVWWSDLQGDPVTTMYKYSELDVVLYGAKEASRLIDRYADIREKHQKKVIHLPSLGGYVHVLGQRGRLKDAS